MDTKDSFGNILNTGDSVKLTKDLKVKGTSFTVKKGQTVKKIRVTENPEEIDGIKNTLKTCFVKKFVK